MYKLIENSSIKNGFKIIIYILLTITCIYWLIYLIYKILDTLRIVLHTMTEKSHWWFFISLCIIFAIGTMVLLETTTEIKPFTSLQRFFIDTFYAVKNWVIGIFVH